MSGRIGRFAVLTALVAVAATGCATTITGTAQRGSGQVTASTESSADPAPITDSEPSTEQQSRPSEPTTSAAPRPTDVVVKPKPPQTPDEEEGKWLEGRRLANQMPQPSAVDARLSQTASMSTLPITEADALGLIFSSTSVDFITRNGGFEVGFSTANGDADSDDSLLFMALEFDTPENAKLVAEGMLAADPENVKVEIPDRPDAYAVEKTYEGLGTHSVEVTVAQGSMVLYLWASSAVGTDVVPFATSALTVLTAGFKDFVPTPADERVDLPADVDDIVAHTLGADRGRLNGWYTDNGLLHFQSDSTLSGDTFADAGVDLGARGAATVYRAADADGANLIVERFTEEIDAMDGFDIVEIEEAPELSCLTNTLSAIYVCLGTTDRYAFELDGEGRDTVVAAAIEQQALLGLL